MKKAIALAAVLISGTAVFLAVDTADRDSPRVAVSRHASPDIAPGVDPASAPRSPAAAPAQVIEAAANPRVRQDRNCILELVDYVTSSGEMISAYRCTPKAPRQPHPYDHYDNGSLEVLAWSDPEAAALLGRRLAASDPGKSYEMLLRATALGGDSRHLSWLADQAFSAIRIDGDLHINNVKRRYELAALAAHFGGDPATSYFLRDLLVDAGLGVDSLDALDERVEVLLESVRDTQRSVRGEIRYGGQDDA